MREAIALCIWRALPSFFQNGDCIGKHVSLSHMHSARDLLLDLGKILMLALGKIRAPYTKSACF